MDLKGNNYCILPFSHLAIESNGEVKGCCLTPAFKTESGRPFNLNDDSFESILSLEDRKRFIDAFKKGERHPYCKECWDKEDNDCISNRIKFTKEVLGFEEFRGTLDESSPKYIEVKMGNTCNLKCCICGPINSSKWVSESVKCGEPEIGQVNTRSRWVKESDFWDSPLLNNAKIFHLMGGEPFLQKRNRQFLGNLISSGRASGVHIRYNTNGTVFDEEIAKCFEHFKSVRVNFSLDDIGMRFEYQRYPAKFDNVIENLEKFAQVRSSNTVLSIDICWSFLNIRHCEEIVGFYRNFSRDVLKHGGEPLAYGRHFYSGRLYDSAAMDERERALFLKKIESAQSSLGEKYDGLLEEMKRFVTEKPFQEAVKRRRDERMHQMDQFRGLKYSEAYGYDL